MIEYVVGGFGSLSEEESESFGKRKVVEEDNREQRL